MNLLITNLIYFLRINSKHCTLNKLFSFYFHNFLLHNTLLFSLVKKLAACCLLLCILTYYIIFFPFTVYVFLNSYIIVFFNSRFFKFHIHTWRKTTIMMRSQTTPTNFVMLVSILFLFVYMRIWTQALYFVYSWLHV